MSQVSSLQSVDIEANDRSFTGQDAAVLVSLHRLDEAQPGMERCEQDFALRATVQQGQHGSRTRTRSADAHGWFGPVLQVVCTGLQSLSYTSCDEDEQDGKVLFQACAP